MNVDAPALGIEPAISITALIVKFGIEVQFSVRRGEVLRNVLALGGQG